ncbi:MAG: glycosyltransferase [Saprospiraceae bacterium]|nr:glycosyltransferase [Saprospiraceae bacterium]
MENIYNFIIYYHLNPIPLTCLDQTQVPTYSFIVATYNRKDELLELLPSLEGQSHPAEDFELVLVDDGSIDGTAEMIEALETSYALQYHPQENQGPGPARNLGMSMAKGDYFIFVDSDCILPTDFLAKVHVFLSENPVDCFGGPDNAHPSFSSFLKAVNYSMTSFLGTGGTRGSKTSVTRFYPRSFNMGIKKEVYQKIGGMGNLRHGQDMDYSMRVYQAGFDVALIPDAFVYHKRRSNLRKFFKQVFNFGVARINLGRKYPSLLKPIHLLPLFLLSMGCILLVLSLMVPTFRVILKIGLVGMLALALMAFSQSFLRWKNPWVALLSVVTLFTQVIAYALGSASGLWQWAIGKSESKGFTKNYYR